ncbi:MAG: hypothetical protein MJ172_06395 [Clostridia bacterium]|nr:hypothetical protein [Clostridia bacterium]
MGFINSILKVLGANAADNARREINSQVNNKIDNVMNKAVNDAFTGASSNSVVRPRRYNAPRKSLTATKDTVRTAEVIRSALSRYSSIDVKEDYQFAGPEAQNASFAIFQDGAPKLYVMIVGRNTLTTHAYLVAKEKAAEEGVKLINFIEYFRNDPSYVDSRLAENIL